MSFFKSKEKKTNGDSQAPANIKPKVKRKKKITLKLIITVVAIIIALLFVAFKFGMFNSLLNRNSSVNANTLSVYSVTTKTITKTLTSTGTIQPNDSYTITALVSGEILADHFEEGDTVEEDQLLYEIDSDNLASSVKRAENALKKAQTSLDEARENLEKLDIKSENTGTIQKLYVEQGDEINAGQVIADVIDKSIMCIDIPFISTDAANISVGDNATLNFDTSYEELMGTVTEISPTTSVNSLGVITRTITISVNNTGSITPQTIAYAKVGEAACTASANFYYNDEGQIKAEIAGEIEKLYFDEGDTIRKQQIIAKLSSKNLDNQIESLELSLDDATSSLEDALDAYDNYNITSPISGTVISKAYKAGDTLGGGNSGGNSMAVIYDMSAFKFEMSIDELDIDSLSVGQEVVITSDARQGKEYFGKITNVSIQGSTSSGTTVYPVTVTIENTEDEKLRTTDKDGTIHKTYKTGKTSVTKTYELAGTSFENGYTTYKYTDDISIIAYFADNGDVTLSTPDGKELRALSDGSYTQGKSFYNFEDGFSKLVLEVTDETKMLKPGMNINADIVVQKSENVISVPVSAVLRGNMVKVVTSNTSQQDTKGSLDKDNNADITQNTQNTQFPSKDSLPADFNQENLPADFNPDNTPSGFDAKTPPEGFDPKNIPSEFTMKAPENASNGKNHTKELSELSPGEYGTAPIDTQYKQVQVEIGINDSEFVEITSGLNVGDIVILDEINSSGIGKTTQNNMQMSGMGMMGMGGSMSMGGMGGPPSGMGGGRPSGMGF